MSLHVDTISVNPQIAGTTPKPIHQRLYMSNFLTPSRRKSALAFATAGILSLPMLAFAESAYLEITLKVDAKDRPAAGAVYAKYRGPFLKAIPGAKSKELLMRDDDVQVLHGFATRAQAEAYLKSDMFNKDVVTELSPLLKTAPEVRIYTAQ